MSSYCPLENGSASGNCDSPTTEALPTNQFPIPSKPITTLGGTCSDHNISHYYIIVHHNGLARKRERENENGETESS